MADHRKHFFSGMRDGIPIALGYFAVSFTLGIACRNIGLSAMCRRVLRRKAGSGVCGLPYLLKSSNVNL